jgi:hypothetical protein
MVFCKFLNAARTVYGLASVFPQVDEQRQVRGAKVADGADISALDDRHQVEVLHLLAVPL